MVQNLVRLGLFTVALSASVGCSALYEFAGEPPPREPPREGQLPEGFPDDVPLYPGSSNVHVTQITMPDLGPTWVVDYDALAEPDKVLRFYERELDDWRLADRLHDAARFEGTGGKRRVGVGVLQSSDGAGSLVMLSVNAP